MQPRLEVGDRPVRARQVWRVADGLGVPVTELLGVTRTNTNEITDMVDTPMARRLMEAFQGLTSSESVKTAVDMTRKRAL